MDLVRWFGNQTSCMYKNAFSNKHTCNQLIKRQHFRIMFLRVFFALHFTFTQIESVSKQTEKRDGQKIAHREVYRSGALNSIKGLSNKQYSTRQEMKR